MEAELFRQEQVDLTGDIPGTVTRTPNDNVGWMYAQPVDKGSLCPRLCWNWVRLNGLPSLGPACLGHMPGAE